ncbi:MAG: hypothetical protein I3273_01275 [Candidatus Moeniiplasma glomeromycotorum]|nr:hypothetical protein [Candidatus Moeniiplasma glomeromycotorum]MCE8167247.1 hypothetical protein [Candidatus Moeniiplasma glomeromycotorum]MCE8168740.1 hypothetical protein [Candidatus Moeniiplasma glomeromycotorum]
MTVRLLFFSGSWANEGNFYLLETEKDILLLAAGKAFLSTEIQEQQVGQDYLKENKAKVRAIIILNTNWQNVGFLEEVCQNLGNAVPLYTSYLSKLVLNYLFPPLRNPINLVEKNQTLKVGDLVFSGLPLNSYLVGNLGLVVHYNQFSFYFLEGVIFNTLLTNRLLSPPHFLADLSKFLTSHRKYPYLITNLQGLHWKGPNSLFLATRYFPTAEETYFFIFYDYDWLHILELLEIAYQRKQKVRILEENFSELVSKKILGRSSLQQVIQTSEEKNNPSQTIYLLTGNPENIEINLKRSLEGFSLDQKANFHFVVGIPPVIGGEEKLAQVVDYLHTQSEKITNLSKKEYLSLGIDFASLKLLLNWLQPAGILTYQNSYKNAKFFPHLPGRFSPLQNGCAFDFSTRKSMLMKPKKSLINVEELLIHQREIMGEEGVLILLLMAEWKETKLQLKKVRIERLAISPVIELPKLENKIKNWWTTKLTSEIKKTDSGEKTKKMIKNKLNHLVSNYLNSEHEIEIEEPLTLLFIN